MINVNQNIKHAIILFLGIMVFLFPVQLQSQTKSILDSVISFKSRNITLYEGLNQISDAIEYEFSYNADLIASESRIKVNYDNISVNNLLSELLKDSTLTFHVTDKQIIILKKNSFQNLNPIENELKIENRFQINGNVYDRRTKEPLAFANIALLGKSIGSVTNEQGIFNLKIKDVNFKDTLVISYIGYKNTYVPVNQLSLYNNSIYLEENLVKIQEVIIRIHDPIAILRESIKNIKNNYYTDPYYITSFYRERVTKQDELASITEAVIEVYKSPYWGLFSDQMRVVKSRKNEYYNKDDSVSLKLKGGLYASLYLDAIKNPPNFLKLDQLHNYTYSISEIVNYDDNIAYVIDFKPKVYLEEQTFEGKIYVNTDNLAVVAINYNITPAAIKKVGKRLVVKKRIGTKVRPTSVKYRINYRKINGKYYMNLTRGELEFKINYKQKLFSKDFKTIFEFASNNIDTADVERFDRVETISTHKVFIDEDFQYDHQFWGDYNYISPDETIEEALIRIQKKIEELDYK